MSATKTQGIRLVHRNRIVEVREQPITTTVLQWLRAQPQHCTGTKEGCAEGDCGACTVVVAELAKTEPSGSVHERAVRVGPLLLRPINACIAYLPTLHGKALITVEDLKQMAGPSALHPVQQAMVDCHGSQCGFCTPGFVMSLYASYERGQCSGNRPGRQQIADDIAGNLCRCTGYRPILDAGEAMFDMPAVRLDAEAIAAQLRTIDATPLDYRAPDRFGIDGPGATTRFLAPRTVDELAKQWLAASARGRATLLAGATDIGLWTNKMFRELGTLVCTLDVPAMRAIESRAQHLSIGAAARLEDAWAALQEPWPELRELALRFAGPPIRHAGTLGGNVANGSPIGDGAPALIALDAQLVLQRGPRVRELALESFYLDYMKNALEPGEFIRTIKVPDRVKGDIVRAWKHSKRMDSDISSVCGVFRLRLASGTSGSDAKVEDLRIVFGGMAAIVKRAHKAEAALRGQPWTETRVKLAMDALDEDFTPMTDLRASDRHRMRIARNLLWRLWLQTRPDKPLDAHATRVPMTNAEVPA